MGQKLAYTPSYPVICCRISDETCVGRIEAEGFLAIEVYKSINIDKDIQGHGSDTSPSSEDHAEWFDSYRAYK